MGRAAKSRRRAEKMKERNRIKAARQAQFASEAAAGKRRRTEGQMPRKLGRHPHGACPNIGCLRCSEQRAAGGGDVFWPRVTRKGRVISYERWATPPDFLVRAMHALGVTVDVGTARRVLAEQQAAMKTRFHAGGTPMTVPPDLDKRAFTVDLDGIANAFKGKRVDVRVTSDKR
jgi:hypothetical protein